MRLYLINPSNEAISLINVKANRGNKWRVWKPLGLLNLAAMTPPEWEITVFDENVRCPDYAALPKPDLVGLTAFTSQAERAYELAKTFRQLEVPVVMGGIHASMRPDEAQQFVDCVVLGEAEEIWPQVLADLSRGELKPRYDGGQVDLAKTPPARHDLLVGDYIFGSVQTTRGCPLSCSFCSVSAFNGKRYRPRPIDDVVAEIKAIPEKFLLIVDDNLIGTSAKHIARAKELFRAMIAAKVRKRWMAQVTVNMADDEELMKLARRSGCFGVFIGFESPTEEGLVEVNKRFNLRGERDFRASSRRLQRHNIGVMASFIIGLDVDQPGIGARIADAAHAYGVDLLNLLFLTPLPGTQLWTQLEEAGRIAADRFPDDWRHYTLNLPVSRHLNMDWDQLCDEFVSALRGFYTYPRILRRIGGKFLRTFNVVALITDLITNFMYRRNIELDRRNFDRYDASRGGVFRTCEVDGVPALPAPAPAIPTPPAQ